MTTSTRNLLLLQALRLFASKGYEGVGVQEIVASCNVSKPTLYHYFKSKIGLLEGLMEEYLSPLLEELEALEASESFERDLIRCGLIMTSFAEANPQVYRLLLSLVFACPEQPQFEVAEAYTQRQFAAIEKLFASHRARMTIGPNGETVLHAALFQGLLHNLITLFLHGHIRLEEKIVREGARLFLHGLHPGPSTAFCNTQE